MSTYEDEDVVLLNFKLDFMNPLSGWNQIRKATFTIQLSPVHGCEEQPRIRTIMPVAQFSHISGEEITTGQRIAAGISTDSKVGGVNLSFENLRGTKTSFLGNCIIHGLVENKSKAVWTLREEPNSKSGLPPVVKLRAIVRSTRQFYVSAQLTVKMQRFRILWSGWVAENEAHDLKIQPDYIAD
jgi:hypothetical protein